MTEQALSPLTGYRHRVDEFHDGRWLHREMVSFRDDRRVPLFHDALPPERTMTHQVVSSGYALVSFADIDWVDGRSRLEVRLLDDSPSSRLHDLLADVIRIGFERFNLTRLEGWVTPVHYDIESLLRHRGFALEAVVPHGARVDGSPVDRQIWGLVRER
ncbi:hypothetical protein LFM09_15860 [Lentzea alba]|uniref:hypothetical protein n=1 Tax=Lentzea alba TaxID=2714351 RepID=UPI0039BFB2E9